MGSCRVLGSLSFQGLALPGPTEARTLAARDLHRAPHEGLHAQLKICFPGMSDEIQDRACWPTWGSPCAGMGLPCAPWWRVHVCGHSCGSRRLRFGAGQLEPPTPQARTPDPAAYTPMHQLLWSRLCFPEASGVPGRGTCAWGRTPGSDLWENLPYPLSKSPKPCPGSEVPISTGICPHLTSGEGSILERGVWVGDLRIDLCVIPGLQRHPQM